ncbi:adenylyltransferase/cytidyltransferase family protein [Candidatus Uhrbacteria bacterium]|nr:adenylyltransferase/cytidyltransferase family protein [Candidatus Uhrbacteria bacterium]
MKRGMVFGTFDSLHPGHQWFLERAREACDKLTVVVAQDHDVVLRKGRAPAQALNDRMSAIRLFLNDATVIAGDDQLGQWRILERYPIDVCILGYDQSELLSALTVYKTTYHRTFQIISFSPYHPDRYKSSLYVRS